MIFFYIQLLQAGSILKRMRCIFAHYNSVIIMSLCLSGTNHHPNYNSYLLNSWVKVKINVQDYKLYLFDFISKCKTFPDLVAPALNWDRNSTIDFAKKVESQMAEYTLSCSCEKAVWEFIGSQPFRRGWEWKSWGTFSM